MKLEILRDEIRIVPENDADRAYIQSLASKQNQAKAVLEYPDHTDASVMRLVVKPFCCGEGPSRPS